MQLPNELVRDFTSLVTGKNEKKPRKESTAYGVVQKNSSGISVKLDGSDIFTPVTTIVEVENGDRVMVTIKNHSMVITGNISNPSLTRLGEVYIVETIQGLKIGKMENDQPVGEYILLAPDGTEIYNSSNELLAKFGSTVRIGKSGKPYVGLTDTGFNIYNASGNVIGSFNMTSNNTTEVTLGMTTKYHLVIDEDSVDICNASGAVLATFGTTTQIGKNGKPHVTATDNGVDICNSSGNVLASFTLTTSGTAIIFYNRNGDVIGGFADDSVYIGKPGHSKISIFESQLIFSDKSGNQVGAIELSSTTADNPNCDISVNHNISSDTIDTNRVNVAGTDGLSLMEGSQTGRVGLYDRAGDYWIISRGSNYGEVYLYEYLCSNLTIDKSYVGENPASAFLKLVPCTGDQEPGNAVALYASNNGNRGVGYYNYEDEDNETLHWLIYRSSDNQTYVPGLCTRTVQSNTTSEYIVTKKYSDGRLVTDMRVRVSANFNTAWGGLYYTGTALSMPAFPITYTSAPVVVTNVRHVNGQAIAMLMSQNSASSTNPGSVYAVKSGSGTATIEITIHAEGTWK